MSTTSGTAASSSVQSGGYRIKFRRDEFLRLLREAKLRRVYRVKNFHYFSFDGFVFYTEEVSNDDVMDYDVFKAIEFSNYPWTKK